MISSMIDIISTHDHKPSAYQLKCIKSFFEVELCLTCTLSQENPK